MKCPKCNRIERDQVINRTTHGHCIKRQRKCLSCGSRFFTVEREDFTEKPKRQKWW